MPVNEYLRLLIDTSLMDGCRPEDFLNGLTLVVGELFQLVDDPNGRDDLRHTANYLSYRISSGYIRGGVSPPLQGRYALACRDAYAALYNDRVYCEYLSRMPRGIGLSVLANLYNFHAALTFRSLAAPNPPAGLFMESPLNALQAFVGAAYGPWLTLIASSSVRNGLQAATHATLVRSDGNDLMIWLGRYPRVTMGQIRCETWNMQGATGQGENKWTVRVRQIARENDLILLQEAGEPPLSAQFISQVSVQDQFGVQRHFALWAWETSGTEWYYILFYDTGNIRVNLAIVLNRQRFPSYEALEPSVISDGLLEPTEGGTRPAIGVRCPNGETDVSVYSFHASSSPNPGFNCRRLLREIAWHAETHFIMAGDFNRDPRPDQTRPNGPWVTPPGLARIDQANGPTHPREVPVRMLDYAVSTLPVPTTERPTDRRDSDHLSVQYVYCAPLD